MLGTIREDLVLIAVGWFALHTLRRVARCAAKSDPAFARRALSTEPTLHAEIDQAIDSAHQNVQLESCGRPITMPEPLHVSVIDEPFERRAADPFSDDRSVASTGMN